MNYSSLFFILGILPLQGALVSLVTEGVIDQSSEDGIDLGTIGNSFRLSISYRSDLQDSDPSSLLSTYVDDDLSVTLEFIESGEIIRGTGGSIIVNTILASDEFFPVSDISFLSNLPLLGTLFLSFTDSDGALIPNNDLPTQFGDAQDYDTAGFSIIDLKTPRTIGGSPIIITPLISGNVSTVSIPEPSIPSLSLCLLLAFTFKRKRSL